MKKLNLFNRESSVSRILMSFLLLGIILVTGCSSTTVKSTTQDKNITTIKTVLNQQFTGPDLKLVELQESEENLTVIGKNGKVKQSESPTELEKYYDKLYRAYFTEKMYDKFLAAYAYYYQFMAHKNGYQLKVENIDIKKIDTTEGAYEFNVSVLYGKDGSKQKNAEVSGRVYFNKDGKINYIRYLDNGELNKAMIN